MGGYTTVSVVLVRSYPRTQGRRVPTRSTGSPVPLTGRSPTPISSLVRRYGGDFLDSHPSVDRYHDPHFGQTGTGRDPGPLTR